MPLFQRSKALVVAAPDNINAQLIAQWLHGRPATTQAAYTSDLARLLHFLDDKPLQSVTLADLQQFADSLAELAPASQARILKACKSVLTFGTKTMPGLFPINAGAALKTPKIKEKLAERIMSEEEIARMIALEDDRRNHAIIRLLYTSAVRRSELVGLCWRDVQERPGYKGGQITVFGKGGKTRVVLLSFGIWHELLEQRNGASDDAPVFNLSSSQIYVIVRKAAQRAGIEKPVSPHWMRHAHASHALNRGAPISLVSATLGHSSIAVTGRYTHAQPDESSGKYLPL